MATSTRTHGHTDPSSADPNSSTAAVSYGSTVRLPLNLFLSARFDQRKMKTFTAILLLSVLVLGSSFFESAMAGSSFCDSKCSARCSKAGMQDRCLKYCSICCEKCQCVPSGTYGNKHECPCYRDMKNSKGQPKCP